MYMSPEQIDRDPDIDFRSDIYSLGAVMYEALTGHTPFTGQVVRKILEDVRDKMPDAPSYYGNLKIPKVLSELAMSCLSNLQFTTSSYTVVRSSKPATQTKL